MASAVASVTAPMSLNTSLALLPSTLVPLILKKSSSATVESATKVLPLEIPVFVTAAVPRPNVVLCAEASASSNSALPAAVKSYVAAVPDPVNCIPLSAAEVNPATAANSASYACTSVPIVNPRLVRVVDASVTSSEPVTLTPELVVSIY